MVNRLNQVKKLRKTKKLVVEEQLIRLEKSLSSAKVENGSKEIVQRMDNAKIEIKKLEKDLEKLADLEIKFKQKS